MRFSAGAFLVLLTASSLVPAQSSSRRSSVRPRSEGPPAGPSLAQKQEGSPRAADSGGSPGADKFDYDVEWRLIHAGTVAVEANNTHASVRLESAGIVSSLFKIEDVYQVNYDQPFCATSSLMDSMEGKRHHEARVTYDRSQNRAFFVERDVIRNTVVRQAQTEIPNCVADAVAALIKLRGLGLTPGQSAQIAVSDGRRSANVKVAAQQREDVKTPLGIFHTIRCEAGLLNGVVYTRKGRLFVWLSDDARHLPVQLQLRMNFPIGTVTLRLENQAQP